MPILGFSKLVENKDMTAKRWTNGDIIICLSRNIWEKEKLLFRYGGMRFLWFVREREKEIMGDRNGRFAPPAYVHYKI